MLSPPVQPIPFFQLLTGRPRWIREPKNIFQVPSIASASGKYTEYYCQAGGSQLNSGSDNSNTAKFTSTNGNWSTATNVFTPTDGTDPFAAGVRIGDFCSIYIDGATVGVFVAAVIGVVNGPNGTITVDATRRIGTPPTTLATTRTIKVGGAWKGPQGGDRYPFSLNNFHLLADVSGHIVRVNMKNDQVYLLTGTGGVGINGTQIVIQGYSSIPGDGGKATFDGNGSVNGNILTCGGTGSWFIDLIVQNNVQGNNVAGFNFGSGGDGAMRCVANTIGGLGFTHSSSVYLIECEAYNCNKVNSATGGGFSVSSNSFFLNCVAHDNNGDGFAVLASAGIFVCVNCISYRNKRYGFGGSFNLYQHYTFLNCDAYNNTSDGFRLTATTTDEAFITFRNCNAVKNGGFGIGSAGTSNRVFGTIDNCGFGSGLMANAKGQMDNLDMIMIGNTITYPTGLTPWVDPDNGNFKLSLANAIGTGRGAFTQVTDGPTVGYPDIGSAQALVVAVDEGVGGVGGG